MFNQKHISIHFGLIIILLLTIAINPSKAQGIDGFSGSVSTDNIEQGDTVKFSGSIYNHGPDIIYVQAFNVSFMEMLGESTSRDPKIFNLTESFEENGDRRLLQVNSTYTFTLISVVDFNPGRYNVSILFGTSPSITTESSEYDKRYSLTNVEFEIQGVSRNTEIIRIIFNGLLIITGIIIALYLYNRFK